MLSKIDGITPDTDTIVGVSDIRCNTVKPKVITGVIILGFHIPILYSESIWLPGLMFGKLSN